MGIPLPKNILNTLRNICYGIQNARWEDEDKMHLTLRFIGEVEGAQANKIRSVLSEISFPTFFLTIQGVGIFPPRGAPRILWAGITPNPPLSELHIRVEKTLVQKANAAPESRKFHPHITLARLKNSKPKELHRYISMHNLLHPEPFEVKNFQLYSSILTREGSRYRVEDVYSSQ